MGRHFPWSADHSSLFRTVQLNPMSSAIEPVPVTRAGYAIPSSVQRDLVNRCSDRNALWGIVIGAFEMFVFCSKFVETFHSLWQSLFAAF